MLNHPRLTSICSFKHFENPPVAAESSKRGRSAPHVTVIRPVKGLEPYLFECIAATFLQDYPKDRFSVRLCVEDKKDPAYPILKDVIKKFPKIDAKIMVEAEDPMLYGEAGHVDNLGPNPKIRNISRAYREAEDDIIWIIDCNVWVARGAMGRMVDKLMGFSPDGESKTPYKFVHHMPLAVDVVHYTRKGGNRYVERELADRQNREKNVPTEFTKLGKYLNNGGGRLDEMFMATTHVKFYGAINTVGIAPCIVGKSNMFRKAHLDRVTDPTKNPLLRTGPHHPTGVDFFSHHICEDHLIGDLLWRYDMHGYNNHGLMWGDLVIQPMAGVSVLAYAARRCRWLRARKFTVLAATLVEPGVESILCCSYFAFGITTLPFFEDTLGIPSTWYAGFIIWLITMYIWLVVDYSTFCFLHQGTSVESDEDTPPFARGTMKVDPSNERPQSDFIDGWCLAWLGREMLALPIWIYAVLLGTTVSWRGRDFHVNLDTTVVSVKRKSEIDSIEL